MTLGISKIWQWISLVLVGFAAGIIVAVKYVAQPGQEFHVEFKKVKQKIRGKGHTTSDTFDIPVVINTDTKDKKTKRKERREARKKRKS